MIQIKIFEESFRSAVVQLWTDCGLVKSWNDPNKDIDRKLQVSPQLFLVAVDQGQLVGTVMGGYEGHRGWINYLAVSPERQHQGVGRQLIQAIEGRLKELDCPKINLQIRSGNQSVIDFYQRLGYRQDEVVSMGKRLQQD